MPRIPGHYEWDDDELTPSQKKEGGLHQNLFKDGKLKGSARFIPGEERDSDPVFIYVEDHGGYRSKEEEEWAALLSQVVNNLVTIGIAHAKPHAKRFWLEKVRPALQSRVDWVADRRAQHRKRRDKDSSVEVVSADTGPSEEIAAAGDAFKANMTSSEAQARYLLALAARQFADEQMRIMATASIQDDENVSQLGQALSELPPDRVAEVIALLEANPSLLGADVLLGPGQVVDGELVDREPDESGADGRR